MDDTILNKSRFCYSYKPPGFINKCCKTANECYNISTLSINTTQTTERSLLLASQLKLYKDDYNTHLHKTLHYTNNNISNITSTLYGQLIQLKNDRYQPYQPYVPVVLPPSVMQLQMNSVNVGVPHSIFSMNDCKDSQTVTTSTRIIY